MKWVDTIGKSPTDADPPDAPWVGLSDGCIKQEDGFYVCDKETLEKAYDSMVHLYYDLERAKVDIMALQESLEIAGAHCESRLNEWHRKWYIVGPIALVVGIISGGAGVALSPALR